MDEFLKSGMTVAIVAFLENLLDNCRWPCWVVYIFYEFGKVTGGPVYLCISERICLSSSYQ